MSFIRSAWPLKYFRDTSHEYVFLSDDGVEDYGSNYEHKPSLVELLASFVLDCTGDKEYTHKIVTILARDYKIEHKLRNKPATWNQVWKEMNRRCKEFK